MTNTIAFNRGYTGHETLREYGLINMNGRLYAPTLGRFLSPDNYVQMPENSQNLNRYSYCLNNPLNYTDPDGEFIFTIFAAVTDFVGNVFKHGVNFSSYNWTKTTNGWKIDTAPFRGNPLAVFSNLTWGSTNTLTGNLIGHFTNMTGMIDGVSNMDGMTAIGGVTGGGAFTIGPYSFGPDGYEATWKDHLFVHEYGHYQQHLRLGPAYLPVVGVPSLLSASHLTGSIPHKMRWFEVDASRRGAEHFDKKYGRGKEGYEQGSADYFDINSFQSLHDSPYSNPRDKTFNNRNYFPISNSISNSWDYIIPSLSISLLLLFI